MENDPDRRAHVSKVVQDKSKRDEWSEGGVASLLEAYEAKWSLRNRAKLKGSDWEDIARQVSVRCSGTRAGKTPNQCKNKIESMKKRYRAESAAHHHNSASSSAWQFYSRMDGLLKGSTSSATPQALPPKVEVDLEVEGDQDDGSNTLPNNNNNNNNNNLSDDLNEKKRNRDAGSNDASTPESSAQAKRRSAPGSAAVAKSIRLLADAMLKIEEGRMEMGKDMERMRVEAEIKRGEMELKRVEIIAETQLEIARLFSGRGKSRSSSWRNGEGGPMGRDGMGS